MTADRSEKEVSQGPKADINHGSSGTVPLTVLYQ
jgi:hypothetical protein